MTPEELAKLTPEEKRIRIAELCGYERIEVDYESSRPAPRFTKGTDGIWRTSSANKWNHEITAQNIKCVGSYFVHLATGQIYADFDGPDTGDNGQGNFDYLNDLNAMHEVEHNSTFHVGNYCEALMEITSRGNPENRTYWNLLHATAAQRADAFLLCLSPDAPSSHGSGVASPKSESAASAATPEEK